MKCIELEDLISLYIDDKLDGHAKDLLEKHLDECISCKQEYEAIISNINMCRDLPLIPLPEDFQQSLHEKLLATTTSESPKTVVISKVKRKFNWKIYGSIAAVFIVFFITLGSTNILKMEKSAAPQAEMAKEEESFGSMEQPASPMENYDYNSVAPEAKIFTTNESESMSTRSKSNMDTVQKNDSVLEDAALGRKVINNAFVNLDVEEYDVKFDHIVNLINSKGGFIEHSNTQYKFYVAEKPEESLKTGSINARIPSKMFLDTVNEIKSFGVVTNFGIGGEDITTQYRDSYNEAENLKIQEQRLREIMNQADNVKDILEVERELTRVRGEINRLTGDLKRWDNLVELSTVSINLNEVIAKDKKIQPVSENIWSKASKGFIETVNNLIDLGELLVVKFISLLPIIIIILLFLIIPVIIFIRRIRRRE